MDISAITSATVSPASSVATGNKLRAAQTPDAQRKAVAAQFEAILVRQMLSKSVGSMLGGSDDVSGSVYGDMMTDVIAQKLTAGPGLGLGRMIEQQLTPRGSIPSAPAAPAGQTL